MTSQEVEKRSPEERVLAQIRRPEFQQEVQEALPPNVSAQRFVRAAKTALLQRPDLVEAEPRSLFRAFLVCAQFGLMPDGNEAVINVYNTKIKDKDGREHWEKRAQCLVMIGGLRKIAAENGWTLWTAVVRERDHFDYDNGAQTVTHKQPPLGEDRGELVGAYAVARNPLTGEQLVEVMDGKDIAKARAASKTADRGPWKDWPERMWEKTPGKRLAKKIPLREQDVERVNRILAADSTSGQSTTLLYGPSEDERGLNQPPTPGLSASAALAPGPQPSASEAGSAGGVPLKAPADPAHVEPEPSLDDGERSQPLAIVDPAVLAAQAAAHFHPPSGQYRDLSFSEIQESGPKGEGWFAWALRTITTPPAYVQALRDYTRVYLPETYTRVMAEMEAS